MNSWQNVKVPSSIDSLPRDSRHFPVPVITPREDGEFFLGQQDNWRVLWCFLENLCSVCGGYMSEQWRFFTPPFEEKGEYNVKEQLESFFKTLKEQNNSFILKSRPNDFAPSEAPFHLECGLYSLAVCPYLASPNSKFKGIKKIGLNAIDRWGMYLGEAKIANLDTLTLRADWYIPDTLLDDKPDEAVIFLDKLEIKEHLKPVEWDLPEKELRRHINKVFETKDSRMYHRARQGKGIWGSSF